MPKVLISDKLSPLAAQVFKDRGVEVDVKTDMDAESLMGCVGQYDGIAIRSATQVNQEVLEVAKNLKVVGRAGIGVDNIDVLAATQNGVVVMNTPFGNAITTAEHSISMMMALARQIPQANASTHEGRWEKTKFMGVELYGKTLGVVGCGNIGSIVADRALGLKMKVIAFDPYLSAERAVDIGVEKVELNELFKRADFITLHAPLTEQTRNLINTDTIAIMKQGVRIVNCARGGLVNELDLRAALESGYVAGAAFDVFETEPAKENVLFGLENVVCTPHLGASTDEAQVNVAVQVAEQMSDYLLTGAVTNALNIASVSAEDAPRLQPYLKLAEQLGSFVGQITRSSIGNVSISYSGAVADLNTKPLTAIAIKGLLTPLMENVNMVNAPIIARERDIEISEVRKESSEQYQTLISLSVTTERQTRTVTGTLFGGSLPRLVEVNGIRLEAEVGRHMLYIINDDKPGFIGTLGSTLGDAGVNIASFHLGRPNEGGDAIALLQLDQEIEGSLLEKVRALPQVYQAQTLIF
ncbi:MAG: phosphoglycerate dehydrogenase [Rhodospirillaceae bacterium]